MCRAVHNQQGAVTLYRFFFLSLACAVFLWACKRVVPIAEIEKNDTFDDAQFIEGNAHIDARITDRAGTNGVILDEDFYYITVAPQEETRIALSITLAYEEGRDLKLYVYNERRHLIDYVNDAVYFKGNLAVTRETLPNLALEKGTYYLKVVEEETIETAYGDARYTYSNARYPVPYTLSLVFTNIKENVEYEVNDTFAKANALPPNETIRGYYAPAMDVIRKERRLFHKRGAEVDMYTFKNFIDLPSSFSVTLSPVEGVDPLLILFDGETRKIVSVDEKGEGEGEVIANYYFEQYSRFYLAVVNKNMHANAKTPYDITLHTTTYDNNDESEPNNDLARAKLVSFGRRYTGRYNYVGDNDVFKVYVDDPVGMNVGCALSPVSNADPVISVLDVSNNVRTVVNAGGRGEGETIANMYVPQGVSFVRISLANAAAFPETPYTLTFESIRRAQDREWENNNYIEEANPVTTSEERVIGFIGEKEDADYFRFYLEEESSVTVEVVPPEALDIAFRLIDNSETPFLRVNRGKAGEKERVVKRLPFGTYYLEVTARNGAAPQSPYTVRVVATPVTEGKVVPGQ